MPARVQEALRLVSSHKYDVLLTDLHMPGSGDGLTVVSAMRHSNPDAVTLLLSGFPEMSEAANAILMQTDEILVKPMKVTDLLDAIKQRINKGPLHKRKIETLATILERTTEESIDTWYLAVEKEEVLMAIALSRERREQGYSAAMMIEESRILQVTIFQTLQKNLGTIDFSVLLLAS